MDGDLQDRETAHALKLPKYRPAKPCKLHLDSAFYTATDRCVICCNTTPRGR